MERDDKEVLKIQEELGKFVEMELPWFFEKYQNKTYGWLLDHDVDYFMEIMEKYDTEGELYYLIRELAKKAKMIDYDGYIEFKNIYAKLFEK